MFRPFMVLLLIFYCSPIARSDEMNTENEQAIKTLIQMTRDENSTIRMLAFGALADVAEDSAEVTMTIAAGTSDEDAEVRAAALHALLDLSNDTDLKASALMTALSDANAEIADMAARKLAEMGQPAVSHLIIALKKDETRMRALQILSNFGSEAKEAVPVLATMAKDDNDEIRASVIRCLSSICSKGPKLSELDPRIRSLVESALRRYDTNSDGELDEDEQSEMRTSLEGADSDGNGRISRSEFIRWYAKRYSGRTAPRSSRPAPMPSPFRPAPRPEPSR